MRCRSASAGPCRGAGLVRDRRLRPLQPALDITVPLGAECYRRDGGAPDAGELFAGIREPILEDVALRTQPPPSQPSRMVPSSRSNAFAPGLAEVVPAVRTIVATAKQSSPTCSPWSMICLGVIAASALIRGQPSRLVCLQLGKDPDVAGLQPLRGRLVRSRPNLSAG